MLFFSALILEGFVFYQVKFRLDTSMIVIAIAFLLQFFLRLPFLSYNGQSVNAVASLAHAVMYFLLYYFIFEMWRHQAKLKSDNFTLHLKATKTLTRAKLFIFTVLGLWAVAMQVFFIIKSLPETYAQYAEVLDVVLIVRGFAKLLLDLFMIWKFR
jgi:hypothetical protein